jgi:hypothetical protein
MTLSVQDALEEYEREAHESFECFDDDIELDREYALKIAAAINALVNTVDDASHGVSVGVTHSGYLTDAADLRAVLLDVIFDSGIGIKATPGFSALTAALLADLVSDEPIKEAAQ